MKNILFLLFSTLFSVQLASGQSARIHLQDPVKGRFYVEARQSYMGGGGYITGIVQHPANAQILYARSDVAGTFKSENGGRSWRSINAGLDKMSDHYCHSLAIDPFDPNVLLRASGDVRSGRFIGRIHRSDNGGESWTLVKDGLDYFGNGPTRMLGELICFHPLEPGVVAAGTYSEGVWISKNSGKSWKSAGLKGERISCMLFSNNRLYATTIPDRGLMGCDPDDSVKTAVALQNIQDKPRKNQQGRIYISENLGKKWDILFQKPHTGIFELVIPGDTNVLLFPTLKGVYRSIDGGRSFRQIEDHYLPQSSIYQTIAVSPFNPDILYTAEKYGREAKVPIYISRDRGASWTLISPHCTPENLHDFPSYHANDPARLGGSISHILPDIANPDKFYFSNFWGITQSDDLGKNYYGYDFKGIEILCMEQIQKHPTRNNVLVAGVCDHSPYLTFDGGESYRSTAARYGPARAVTWAMGMPDFLLWSAQTKNSHQDMIRSNDLGRTARRYERNNGDNFLQALCADPITPGKFWKYVEGDLYGPDQKEGKAGIYYSTDTANTWIKTTSPFPGSQKTIPHDVWMIDRNLTPIVAYQFKNGCGTNQLLTLDAKKTGVVYVGEWTEGIYRSKDNGGTWTKISAPLPFGKKRYSILSFIQAHPYRSGTIYAGFWREGLWVSDDFGDHWRKVTSIPDRHFNASCLSIDQDEKGNTLMALGCSNHPLCDTPIRFYVSTDDGDSWTDIYDSGLGAMRWISVAADASTHKIHAATAGTGIIYFTLAFNPLTTAAEKP